MGTTAADLENLCKDLIGKDYNTYSWSSDVRQRLHPVFTQLDPNDRIYLEQPRWSKNNQERSITYNGYSLGTITVSKAKGARHSSYFGGYNDWTIKGIHITLTADTIEEAFEKAKQSAQDASDKAYEENLELVNKAKKIMQLLNITDLYDFSELIEKFNKKRYDNEFRKYFEKN